MSTTVLEKIKSITNHSSKVIKPINNLELRQKYDILSAKKKGDDVILVELDHCFIHLPKDLVRKFDQECIEALPGLRLEILEHNGKSIKVDFHEKDINKNDSKDLKEESTELSFHKTTSVVDDATASVIKATEAAAEATAAAEVAETSAKAAVLAVAKAESATKKAELAFEKAKTAQELAASLAQEAKAAAKVAKAASEVAEAAAKSVNFLRFSKPPS